MKTLDSSACGTGYAPDDDSGDPLITTAYCPHCGECLWPKPDQWGDIVECETTGKAFRLVPESRLPRRNPNVPADFAGVRDGKIQPVVGGEKR